MFNFFIKFLPAIIFSEVSSKSVKKVLHNIFWLVINLTFKLVAGLVIGAMIARELGPQKFGFLGYIYSYLAIFASFANLGLQGVVVKELIENEEKKSIILNTAIAMQFFAAVFLNLLIILVVVFQGSGRYESIFLIMIGAISLLFKTSESIKYWFESQLKSKSFVLIQNISLLICCILNFYLVHEHAPLELFVLVFSLESLLTFIGFLMILKNSSQDLGINFSKVDFSYAWYMIKRSLPLLISSFSIILSLNLDKIMIAKLYGNTELGFYSVASNLTQIFYVIPVFVGSTLAPLLSVLYKSNKKKYVYVCDRVFYMLFWGAILISVVIFFVGPSLIFFIYGGTYIYSARILSVQVLSSIFLFHVSFRKRLMLIEGVEKYTLALSVSMVIITFVANYMLIPKYGAIGSSFASLISWGFNALVIPLIFLETRKYSKSFFKIIFMRIK